MCLAVPMTVIEISEDKAIVESNGIKTEVNIALSPDLKINDKVLIHAGFIIEKLDEEKTKDIEDAWEEYNTLLEES